MSNSNNCVEKLECGNLWIDLPYPSCIYELPLLSFGDMRGSVTLSLVYNQRMGCILGNSFNIKSGYKLNLQKKIFSHGNYTYLLEENGNYTELRSASLSEVFTLDDDSQRIIRTISSGYELEYPDYSKELYDAQGRISQTFDKYGECVLSYEYTGNLLTAITYRETLWQNNDAKRITLSYSDSKLTGISYSCDTESTTVFNHTVNTLSIQHYSGTNYTVVPLASGFEATVYGSEGDQTYYYLKKCIINSDDNTVSNVDYVGYFEPEDNEVVYTEVNRTDYVFLNSVDDPEISSKCIDITDYRGARTRVQFNSGKLTYSYEIGESDTEFLRDGDNDRYAGTVTVYRTEDDMWNPQAAYEHRYFDGEYMSLNYGGTDNACWAYDTHEIGMDEGYFIISGWAKSTDINLSENDKHISITTGTAALPLYDFYIGGITYNKWTFFAFKFLSESNIIKAMFGTSSGISIKDVRITFRRTKEWSNEDRTHIPVYEDVLIKKTDSSVVLPLDDIYFSNVGSRGEYDWLSFDDVLRSILNKTKRPDLNEFYFSKSKNVVSGAGENELEFKLKIFPTFPFSLSDFYLAKRTCVNKKIRTTVIKDDASDCLLLVETYDENGNIISSQKYNNNFDIISETIDGITTAYTWNGRFLNASNVNNTIQTSVTYDEANSTICKYDAFQRETKYTFDKPWGTLKSIELPDGCIITDTYGADMQVLKSRSFGNDSESKTLSLGYSGGNLTSVSCDIFNYTFSYSDGRLSRFKKFGAWVFERSSTPTNTTTYYPFTSPFIYSISKNYDKYGRPESIDDTLENTYDIFPRFNESTGALVPYVDNASAKLATCKDHIIGKTSRYEYKDEGQLIKKTVSSSTNFSNKTSIENFVYDESDRLTESSFVSYSPAKNLGATISYVIGANDPRADARVSTYKYKLNGVTKAETNNTYDVYHRISEKAMTIGQNTVSKQINRNKTRINRIKHVANSYGVGTNIYQYDNLDRIKKDTFFSSALGAYKTYEYDVYGQLIRENNQMLDKTFIYSYNTTGNIVSVKTYSYTEDSTDALGESYTQKAYTYNATFKDRLVNFGDEVISYDSIGQLNTYRGKTLTWTKGKLTGMRSDELSFGSRNYTFSYNALGQRVSASCSYAPPSTLPSIPMIDGMLLSFSKNFYYDHFGRLIFETNSRTFSGGGSDSYEIVYLYDESSVIGMEFTYNGTTNTYYYRRNLQGDVDCIYDTNNDLKVRYLYDAFGNCTISSDTIDQTLANINPIRYRGYYYDKETELYYLNSRYYSPIWRRFISPDSFEYLNIDTPVGLNLYTYCGNDPVNNVDPSGHFGESFWNGVGDWFEDHWVELAIGTAFIIGGAIVTALTCGAGATAWTAFGSALLSSAIQVGAGIGTGVLVNGVSSLIQGADFFDNVGDTIASSYMLGGILSGGSQMLSGGFRFLRAKTGFKGIDSKNFGLMSADKLYYDKPGMTVLRLGSRDGAKLAIDFGRYGIHGHIWKWSTHIPLIPGIVGVGELF